MRAKDLKKKDLKTIFVVQEVLQTKFKKKKGEADLGRKTS